MSDKKKAREWWDEPGEANEIWTEAEIAQYIVDRHSLHAATPVAQELNEFGQRDAKGRKWNKARVVEVFEANQHLIPTWAIPKDRTTPLLPFDYKASDPDRETEEWREERNRQYRKHRWGRRSKGF